MARMGKEGQNGLKISSWNERIRGLPPKRRELLRPLLEEPRSFLFLSIRALADKLGTDTATMLRAVRGMGFAGYPDFRKYLHELAIAHATSLDSMLAAPARDSDIPAHVRDSLDQDQKNLGALRHSLDAKRLEGIAKRLWSARRIILIGGDLATSLILYLEHHLVMLGRPVFTATSPGRVVNLVRSANKSDLVIAISFRRCLRQTVEGMRQARSRGAHCIGITDTFISPLARFADESFLASVESHHFGGDSYVAPMALLDVILVACANYRRARTLKIVREAAEEQRRGFRWYEDQ
jgi:RpiR family transcriptional regulator, carbohydrate utilization regulator